MRYWVLFYHDIKTCIRTEYEITPYNHLLLLGFLPEYFLFLDVAKSWVCSDIWCPSTRIVVRLSTKLGFSGDIGSSEELDSVTSLLRLPRFPGEAGRPCLGRDVFASSGEGTGRLERLWC